MEKSRLVRIGFETLVLFGGLLVIDHTLFSGAAFDGIQPNPYWLPVLVLALAYGTGPGLAAAAIAIGLWAAAPHDTRAMGDELQVTLYLSLQPLLWVVAAVIIGEVTGNRRSTIDGLQQFARVTAEKQETIAEALTRLSTINRALQVRIATDELSVGQAMEAALGLLERDRSLQIKAVERLIALATQTEDFTYFDVRGARTIARFRGTSLNEGMANLSDADLARDLAGCAVPLQGDSAARLRAFDSVGQIALPAPVRGVVVGMLVIRNLPISAEMETRKAELSHVAGTLAGITARLWSERSSVVSPKWKGSKGKVA